MTQAIDTNIVVRFLMADDERLARAARRIVADGVVVGDTVVLETEWVLRAVYGVPRAGIITALTSLLRVPDVTTADPAGIAEALRLYAAGLDFADAMHAATARADGLRTFDKAFARAAKRARSRTPVDAG